MKTKPIVQRLHRAGAVALAAAMIGGAMTATATAASSKSLTNQQIEARIDAFQKAHPGDLVGLDKLQQSMGAKPGFYLLKGSQKAVSASEAQRLIKEHQAAQKAASPASVFAVPTDSFTVSISGNYYPANTEWRISGGWNFRDNYVNGSDPDDVSNLAADPAQCFNQVKTTYFYMYDYQGNSKTSFSLHDPGLSQPNTTYKINDGVSGFVTNFDHGNHVVYFGKSKSTCAGTRIRAAYKYEHNQDYNNNGIGISVAWGLLSISYSGSGGSKLQKSTNVYDVTG